MAALFNVFAIASSLLVYQCSALPTHQTSTLAAAEANSGNNNAGYGAVNSQSLAAAQGGGSNGLSYASGDAAVRGGGSYTQSLASAQGGGSNSLSYASGDATAQGGGSNSPSYASGDALFQGLDSASEAESLALSSSGRGDSQSYALSNSGGQPGFGLYGGQGIQGVDSVAISSANGGGSSQATSLAGVDQYGMGIDDYSGASALSGANGLGLDSRPQAFTISGTGGNQYDGSSSSLAQATSLGGSPTMGSSDAYALSNTNGLGTNSETIALSGAGGGYGASSLASATTGQNSMYGLQGSGGASSTAISQTGGSRMMGLPPPSCNQAASLASTNGGGSTAESIAISK